MKKVIHIAEDMAFTGGGVASAIRELANNCTFPDLQHEIVTTTPEKSLIPGIHVPVVSLKTSLIGGQWKYPLNWRGIFQGGALNRNSVVHIHGIWKAPQFLAAQYFSRQKIPTILSPHNMLGDWFWRGFFKKWKKTVYWGLVKGKFNRVNVLHALSQQEKVKLNPFFPGKKIEVIPNGIQLEEMDEDVFLQEKIPGKNYLLFLGRLHPVKGIERIIESYSQIKKENRMPLKIAGPAPSIRYHSFLKELVKKFGVENEIEFLGPIYGLEKWNLLKKAWALCAPSYSEGISMSVLEALGCGVPVISTPNCGIDDLEKGGGILVSGNSSDLRAAIEGTISWTKEKRAARARQARIYAKKNYSWETLKTKYQQFYSEVSGEK